MRSREFITESAKLWGAKVRVSQANYVGYVDAQVWAANAQQARTILKQQFNIEDHHVGSVKEIKMKAKEFIKEEWNANMGDIYEAANTAARAFYCIGILTNRAFQQREDPQGRLSEQLADVEEYEEDAEMAMDDLQRLGASLTYNPNSPRMFVLEVPKMEPYTFDVKEIVDTAVN
jgi:hypothetical protein